MLPSFKSIAIVALIAFLAVVIYLLVNHIVHILTITHNVQIEIAEGEAGFDNNMTFKVINNGIMPVNNLNLKIATQYEIISATKDFSSVLVDPLEIKPKFIEAHADKLVHGTGSFILISVSVNESKPTGYNKYSAYAVYNEGSNKADFTPCLAPCLQGSNKADFTPCLAPCLQLHDIEKGLATLDKSIKISLLAVGVTILGAGLLLTLIKFFDYLKNFLNLTKREV